MRANYSAAFRDAGTAPAELEPLRVQYSGKVRTMPSGAHHTDRYKRMLLTGEKPIHFSEYLACLRDMFRKGGRERVAAAVNAWLMPFGLIALPIASDATTTPNEKLLLETYVVTTRTLNTIDASLEDGRVDAREMAAIRELIPRVYEKLTTLMKRLTAVAA